MNKCSVCGKTGNVFEYKIANYVIAYFHKECFVRTLLGKPVTYDGAIVGKVIYIKGGNR